VLLHRPRRGPDGLLGRRLDRTAGPGVVRRGALLDSRERTRLGTNRRRRGSGGASSSSSSASAPGVGVSSVSSPASSSLVVGLCSLAHSSILLTVHLPIDLHGIGFVILGDATSCGNAGIAPCGVLASGACGGRGTLAGIFTGSAAGFVFSATIFDDIV